MFICVKCVCVLDVSTCLRRRLDAALSQAERQHDPLVNEHRISTEANHIKLFSIFLYIR